MFLPNFLIIGTAKSGTTSVAKILPTHPDIGFSKITEPDFFSLDSRYAKGMEYYAKYFDGCEGKKAIGEKSWSYSVSGTYPNALPRIVKHLPDVKIIYMVRHPIVRLESLWMECRSAGVMRHKVPNSLSRAVRTVSMLIDSSRYWSQINAYREFYADEKIKVLFYEDMKSDPDSFYCSLFDFLNVELIDNFSSHTIRENISSQKRFDTNAASLLRSMPYFSKIRDLAPNPCRKIGSRIFKQAYKGRPVWEPDTRQWVVDQLKDEVLKLMEYTNRPSDFWGLSY
jgi:hypothetical protein